MPKQKPVSVTMRVRVGDKEIEVTGPSDFVEKKIAEFLKQAPSTVVVPSAAPSSKEQAVQHSKGTSPAQFFKATNPKTDNDRVVVAAYFLEKYRNAQNATMAEIRDLIAESKRNPPRNTNDAINQNIRKGLLMTAGDRENKMTFVLTSDGEAEVEEMLKTPKE
jgi:hypothetical protein